MIKAYWYDKEKNFGDMLTPVVLSGLGIEFRKAERNETGKLLAIGSIIYAAREKDTLWGTGTMRDVVFNAPAGLNVIAVRGPKTRERIRGCEVPETYGDPAIILPRIYTPKTLTRHKIGYVPHYVDQDTDYILKKKEEGEFIIDVKQDPMKTIDEICSCDKIVSSSLHGIIVAEAYGIPAAWIKLSDKLIGGNFKFNDYFLGSGREEREPDGIDGNINIIPGPKYEIEKLINSIKSWI